MHISYYGVNAKEDVLSLLANASFKRPIINWQFENCTDRRPIVAKEDDCIVGFNGIMPVKIQCRGKVIKAAWSCDFIVKPEYQRRGIGTSLKQKLDKDWPLIMALGVSKAGKRALNRSGWASYGSAKRYTRLLKGRRRKDRLLARFQNLLSLVLAPRKTSPKDNIETTLNNILPKRSDLDALWRSVESQYEACVVRDWQYLNWRYVDAPYGNYQFLQLSSDKNLKALAVISRNGHQLTLVDYVGPRTILALKKIVVDRLLSGARESDRVNCTTSDRYFKTILLRHGFLPASAGHLAFFVRSNALRVTKRSSWFLMGGDSDTEMLEQARARWGQVNVSIWDEDQFLS